MLNTPFSPWPSFTQEEANIVARVLLSNRVNYWTGNECREFEREFAAWTACKHAIALSNGTVALEIALKGLGIGPGDEVIVTPRTFIASVSCIVNAGATPVFADVDLDSQNITAKTISAVLSARTRAIICVHLAGWPCDMDPIMSIANEYGLKVIEDCAQAHGALYNGRSVGTIGHVGAWSFCQDKIMSTAGEGGMLTTNDASLWARMWSYKDHGKSFPAMFERAYTPGYRWVHESFGSNGRMLEIQAAVGRLQLKKMPAWTARRKANAQRISAQAARHQFARAPMPPHEMTHAWYKLNIFIDANHLGSGWSRDRIIEEITALGVPCYTGSCPEVYLEKAFDGQDFRPSERLPNAKQLGESTLMFLVHPTLTDAEIDRTCAVIDEVLLRAGRFEYE
jgi:dTDP-4-amino-4,6-dideoxygalactose transaminase